MTIQGAITGPRLPISVAVVTLVWVLTAVYLANGYLAALPTLMSPTADVAFILFSLAFVASSLRRFSPNPMTRYLLRNRRYIGISFALVHFTHLGLVMSNITMVAGEERALFTIVPGALAYAFIALLAVTSNDFSVRKLGARRWKSLHKIGGYYIWLIFLATTLPPTTSNAWILILSLSVLFLRIAAYQKQRGSRRAMNAQ